MHPSCLDADGCLDASITHHMHPMALSTYWTGPVKAQLHGRVFCGVKARTHWCEGTDALV
eukprot:CAMPEP_0174696628 /NCGR_PEP_ID=MMETSP1094-20130205/2728_1 /TAXON_ID=156173 /ORGANISM="Chrysochromulina brevifilum, Strain UTEX LB 985" /LENGTH=59 /DNA_ID=CAMNT_0015893449 /DNA_START=312 /DNA_END=491 /DNA_ORIENTATION=+